MVVAPQSEVWEDPSKNIRLFGVIGRDGPEWKSPHSKRWGIDGVLKAMKESRRMTATYSQRASVPS